MKELIKLGVIALMTIVLHACKKDPSIAVGSNSIVYESEENVDAVTNFSAFVNLSTLYVENASPYESILGNIATQAQESTINGNGVEISNINITNIRLTTVELYSAFQINDFNTYLQECDLYLQYYDVSTSNYVGSSIATLSSVSLSQSKVLFSIISEDLTQFFKRKPDRLYFKFKFNAPPPQEMQVKYRIAFDYDYSYDERERK